MRIRCRGVIFVVIFGRGRTIYIYACRLLICYLVPAYRFMCNHGVSSFFYLGLQKLGGWVGKPFGYVDSCTPIFKTLYTVSLLPLFLNKKKNCLLFYHSPWQVEELCLPLSDASHHHIPTPS